MDIGLDKAIVSLAEMADRVKSAVDARTDDDFVIMARTDALARWRRWTRPSNGRIACVAAARTRSFPEAVTDLDATGRSSQAVNVPVLANITEFGATPLFTIDDLTIRRCGHRVIPALGIPGRESCRRERHHTAIRRDGTQRDVMDTHANPGRVVRPDLLSRF